MLHIVSFLIISTKCFVHNAGMDDLDQKLIGLLRGNARMTIAELAHRTKVSRGTITHRLQRLESSGVIDGYTVRLRPDSLPAGIRAWMSVEVDGNETRAVIAHLLGDPAIAALHDTNGRWDLLAEIHADSLQQLSTVLERIRLLRGIKTSETSIHLATFRG